MSALSWVTYVIGVSVLLGAGALLLEETLRAAGRGGRWAWLVCLLGSVGLPAVALLTPAPAVPPIVSPTTAAVVLQAPGLVLGPLVAEVERAGPDVRTLLWWGWGLASAVLLVLVLLSWLTLRREAAAWRRAEVAGSDVWLSERRGPAVVGMRRARIVVPEWVLTLSAADQRFAVLHEEEHLRARDHIALLLALLTCLMVPWNPVVWWALHRLRGAVELDCDGRVLARAGDPAGYGRLLVEVGRRHSARHLLAAAFAEPRVLLERRVRALLQWPRGRQPLAASVLGGAALLFFGFAYAAPVPLARPEPASPGVVESTLPDVAAQVSPAVQDTVPQLRNGEEIRRLMESELPASLRGQPGQRRLGAVIVMVLVNAAGGVDEVLPNQRSGNDELDAAALSIARRMEFSPARSGGQSSPGYVEAALIFGSASQHALVVGEQVRMPPEPRLAADVSDKPTYSPMTSPPELSNPTEVQQSLLAEYPPLLRSAGIGGKPIVWLLVAEDGRVARARLHSSSGHEALDSAALRVARRMVFRPAEYQGQRVAVWLDIPIVFTVAEGAQGNQDGQAAARPPAGQRPQQVRAQSIQERPLVNADEIRAAVARNYPPLHRDAGVGGEAVIWIYAEADGTPTKTQVARTSGYPALDDVALKLVDRMRFKVQPSAGWIEVPIVFNAQQASQPQAQQQVRAQTVKERPLVNMPMILAALVREYPPLLRDAGIGGEVVLWIYAEADGTPTKSQLGRTSGYPALDEAALKIVGIMRFKAARTGSWIEVPLSWTAR